MSCLHRFRLPVPAALPLLLAALVPAPVWAIDPLRYQDYPHLEGLPVRQVLILGNNDTREIVFRREMTLTEGVPFTSAALWKDWENLVDLGIFANLEVDAVPSGDGVLVVVSVYERPGWIVAPVLDYDFGREEAIVGYRLRIRNIQGLDQSFLSNAKVGARDEIDFRWESPWLGSHRRSLSVGLSLQLPQTGEDELRTNRLSVATTKYLGDYRRLRRGITYFGRLDVLKRDGTSPAGPVSQLLPALGAGYFRDSRNVRIDPLRGSLVSFAAEYSTGWLTDEIRFLRGVSDIRKFLTLGDRFVLAGRAVSILTTGDVPEYRKVGVGGSGSIRGQPGGVLTGNDSARASVELRFGILPKRRFNLPLPLVPGRIKNFDLRVDGVLFADAGSAWDDTNAISDATIKKGLGVGLRIFLPVLEVARLELAFDPEGRPTLYFQEGNLI